MFSLVKKGVVIKSGWVWSERFENRSKQNAFLRFILKEGGSSIIKWKQNAEKSFFHNFPCIRKSKKRAWLCADGSQMNFDLKFFLVVIDV